MKNGQTIGPLPEDALKGLAQAGVIAPDDAVWPAGATSLMMASQAPTLSHLYQAASSGAQPTGMRQPLSPPRPPTMPGPHYTPQPSAPAKSQPIAGFVLGIIGLLAWLIPLFGFPITITGLILSIKTKMKPEGGGLAVAGIVLNIIGLVATIINMSIGAYMDATGQL